MSAESHPFSLSSAPDMPLRFLVKELGDYTNKIGSVNKGDSAFVEGPFGAFNFKTFANKKQVWIAGGVGIAPFLSMLRSLSSKDMEYSVDFYFSVKDKNSLVFKEEIEFIAQRNRNLNVVFWISDEDGFINANYIKEKTSDIKERDILICGPVPMMSVLKKQFLSLGVDKKSIHIEEFQLY